MHDLVRAHAAAGGAVLLTGRDAGALARTADHVIALDQGPRRRRRGRDAVRPHPAAPLCRGPLAVRPAAGRTAQRRRHGGGRRERQPYRRVRHHLGGGRGDGVPARHPAARTRRRDRRRPPANPVRKASRSRRPRPGAACGAVAGPAAARARSGRSGTSCAAAFGVRTPWAGVVAALVCSVLATVLIARTGALPPSPLRLLSGWAPELPLPAAAIGAGLLGALSYGQEFRYPALAPGHGPEPRSARLLAAKLAVGAATAVLLAAAATAADLAVLRLTAAPRARVPVPLDAPRRPGGLGGAGRRLLLGRSARRGPVPYHRARRVRGARGAAAGRTGRTDAARWAGGRRTRGRGRCVVVRDERGLAGRRRIALPGAALRRANPSSSHWRCRSPRWSGPTRQARCRGRRRGRRSTAVQTSPTAPLTSKKG